jgi:hypothetical protein
MIRGFFKTFLLFSMMFAAQEGFAESSVETLYKTKLVQEYSALQDLKSQASKRKRAYIISGILALLLLGVFAYFFKLFGVITALIMIAAGYFTLKSSEPVVGAYEKAYQTSLISPITKLTAGYQYQETHIKEEDLGNLFAPSIKNFGAWGSYIKKDVTVSYVHVVFDTKENASVERLNQNIFDGYLITINRPTESEGVLVSESLRDKVSGMDMTMKSFFAKGKRADRIAGFDLYGDVSQKEKDSVLALSNLDIAISFEKDIIRIAWYKKHNPFSVDVFQDFDLQKAKSYEDAIVEIDHIVDIFQ